MNTKQVLYNALQVQLNAKKQAYEVYHETVTQPAFHELMTKIREYLTSIAPITDDIELELNNRTLRIKADENRYSSGIELIMVTTQNQKWVDVEWSSGSYNLTGKKNKEIYLYILHSLFINLKTIEDKFINDWKVKYDSIWNDDHNVQKEHTDLQYALNTLSNEIHYDTVNAMKEIGFEIKQFKPSHNLDWDYDKNNDGKRIYKINTSTKSINIQYGRSQYDTTYVNGFKVLGKKGNKYSVEIYREGYPDRKYEVLEKKFESFIDNVVNWEYKQADKYKQDAERNLAERSK
jgi:hypothetical protein